MLNIRSDVKDSFYRYKMPKLLTKIEGRGNGIKTVIPNMSDIAKALSRPPSYPTKYFGSELGAQTKCDSNTDRYIVNGAHDAQKLQSTLDGFIQKFVLCGECLNPETVITIVGNNDLLKVCKACGQKTSIDMRHKLSSYILKNPPESFENKTKLKEEKKTKTESESELEEDNDEEQQQFDIIEPTASEMKSELQDWTVPTEESQLSANMGGLNLLKDEEGDEEEDPFEALASFVENEKPLDQQIIDKIASLGIRNDKAIAVLAQVLFNEKNILKELGVRKNLFSKLIGNEKDQKAFLGGIERLVGVTYPSLLPKIAHILKCVYDLEIVEEEVLISWGDKPSKRYVSKETSKDIREKAFPFLNWLRNAEEESD